MKKAYPSTTAEIKVPAKAKARMTPKFLKKLACLSSKPEFRMIGGSRTLSRMVFSGSGIKHNTEVSTACRVRKPLS